MKIIKLDSTGKKIGTYAGTFRTVAFCMPLRKLKQNSINYAGEKVPFLIFDLRAF